MLRLSRIDRISISFLPVFVAVLIAILFMALPVQAQLTQEDIDKLRERGEQEGWTFEVGLCEANMNYSLQELCGYTPDPTPPDKKRHKPIKFVAEPPTRWDWRDFDGVTSVKNQGNCGSCWAFAVCGPFEAALKIRDGITVDLSEQWLLSCNQVGFDCGGGNFSAHNYHLPTSTGVWADPCGDNGGVREQYFPYTANDGVPCSCPYPHEFWIDDWAYVDPYTSVPSPDTLKQIIMSYGPATFGVYVNDAWYGYHSGVFNACENKTPNHGVTVVGWDDDLDGTGESVWIIKNSWGTDWGMDGYMYIPYGCSRIGYEANYVDCNLAGFMFWADTTIGWVPFEVNFDAYSHLDVLSWEWDFGDGSYAYEQIPPPHIYTQNGSFDVSLTIDLGGGDIRTVSKDMYIIAIADTIKGDTISTTPGSSIEVTLNANNSAPTQYLKIPFEFPNNFGMTYDSFSVVGCRTEYFEVTEYLHWDTYWGKRATLKLVSSELGTAPDLEVGSGPVVKLYFKVPDTATVGQSADIDLNGYLSYLPSYYGDYANYSIASINGRVILGTTCCMVAGDVDHDGTFNILDIDCFINWLFRGGPEAACFEEADADGSDQLNLLDADLMVNYLYRGGPPPEPCP